MSNILQCDQQSTDTPSSHTSRYDNGVGCVQRVSLPYSLFQMAKRLRLTSPTLLPVQMVASYNILITIVAVRDTFIPSILTQWIWASTNSCSCCCSLCWKDILLLSASCQIICAIVPYYQSFHYPFGLILAWALLTNDLNLFLVPKQRSKMQIYHSYMD